MFLSSPVMCAFTKKSGREQGSQKGFTIFPPDAMLFENDPENQSTNRKDIYYVNWKNDYFGSNRRNRRIQGGRTLASLLKKQHADVHVIMTKNALEFITPLTFETLTVNKCLTDTFDRNFKFEVEHIELAKKADLAIIAPATANVCAKLAHGLADDMLTTTLLACQCPRIIAPAMNHTDV